MRNILLIFFLTAMGTRAEAGIYLPMEERMNSRELKMCWWGGYSSATKDLRRQFEEAIVGSILSQSNFHYNTGWPACESLPATEVGQWVNLIIYDDPIFAGRQKEIAPFTTYNFFGGYVTDPTSPGHPRAEAFGSFYAIRKFDLILTSEFQDVKPRLTRLQSELSPQGKANLRVTIALHEFLHILGALHEHSHPDSDCLIEGEKPHAEDRSPYYDVVSAYDRNSIMSRCTTEGHDYEAGPLLPTARDIEALNWVYPQENLIQLSNR